MKQFHTNIIILIKIIPSSFLFLVLFTLGNITFANDGSGMKAFESGEYKKAYEIWLPKAKDGDPDSQAGIGVLFNFGFDVPKNNNEAMKWYRLAAEQGQSDAQAMLGRMYYHGEGAAINIETAIKWYRLAMKQKNPLAHELLGELYNTQGMYDDAERILIEAVTLWEETSGINHPGVARALSTLALVYQNLTRFPDAERVIKRALSINQEILGADHLETAKKLNILGQIQFSQGNYFDAELNYKQAVSIKDKTNDPVSLQLVVTASSNLGLLYQTQAKYSEAEKFFEQSFDFAEKYLNPNDAIIATILNNLAMLNLHQGKYESSKINFEKALKISEKALGQLHPNVAQIQTNLGLALQYQGRYADAELSYKQAILTLEQIFEGNNPILAMSYSNLGLLYQEQGKYPEAETLFNQSLPMMEKAVGINHVNVALILNNLALQYQYQGRYSEAERIYKRSINIINVNFGSEHPEYSRSLFNLGSLYFFQGNYEDAEPLLDIAFASFEKQFGENHRIIAHSLNLLALIYIKNGQYLDAETSIKRSMDISKKAFGPNNILYANSLFSLATLQSKIGQTANAGFSYKQALQIYEGSMNQTHPNIALILKQLSVNALKLNNHQEMLEYIRRASSIYKTRAIFEVGLENSGQKKEQELQKDLYLSHIKAVLQIKETSKRKSLIPEAFETSQFIILTQAGRAMEQFSNRLLSKDKKISLLVRKRQDAAKQWQSLNKALVQSFSKIKGERNLKSEAVLRQSLNEKKDLVNELDYKIRTQHPKFAEFSSIKPIPLDDIQALLANKEALFSFVSSKQETFGFIITKDNFLAYEIDLSEKQFAKIVKTLRDDIDLSNVEGISDIPKFNLKLAHKLYLKLLAPAESILKDVAHLLVVPSGPMESLPFNILLTEPPANEIYNFNNYRSASWLHKRFSVTRLPTVSSLNTLRNITQQTQATGTFKGFGDPILNGKIGKTRGLKLVDLYQGSIANIDKLRNLPELPETANELRIIAKYLNSSEKDLYLQERATETTVKSLNLYDSQILGFATHGLVGGEWDELTEPALVLTPPQTATDLDDGLLKASEVAQLHLNADMIILSACNTASGERIGAEGLSGLARAFIYAGARSLLVSHWSVDSNSAISITTGMFKAIKSNPNMGRATALQKAMAQMASSNEKNHYSHPAFWAAFSLIGEGAENN
ncbi:tetratricopeptide repeat protein [Amylibacter sp.]|nr:tetratricopeptide repeat protein [Amylibacter sp.]MDB9786173.1 tetratricopeptide repeat protein [Amylibacter sp.]